jgi:hypothetical protein
MSITVYASDALTRSQAMETARRMHAGGWKITEIRDYLAARGVERSWDTVKGWVDPEWAERRREAHRANKRKHWRRKAGNRVAFRVLDEHTKLDVMRELRAEGLSHSAIAGAFKVLLSEELSRSQVEYALEHGRYPARARRAS